MAGDGGPPGFIGMLPLRPRPGREVAVRLVRPAIEDREYPYSFEKVTSWSQAVTCTVVAMPVKLVAQTVVTVGVRETLQPWETEYDSVRLPQGAGADVLR